MHQGPADYSYLNFFFFSYLNFKQPSYAVDSFLGGGELAMPKKAGISSVF